MAHDLTGVRKVKKFLRDPYFVPPSGTIPGATGEVLLALDNLFEPRRYAKYSPLKSPVHYAQIQRDLSMSRGEILCRAAHLFSGALNPDTVSTTDADWIFRKVQRLRNDIKLFKGRNREDKIKRKLSETLVKHDRIRTPVRAEALEYLKSLQGRISLHDLKDLLGVSDQEVKRDFAKYFPQKKHDRKMCAIKTIRESKGTPDFADFVEVIFKTDKKDFVKECMKMVKHFRPVVLEFLKQDGMSKNNVISVSKERAASFFYCCRMSQRVYQLFIKYFPELAMPGYRQLKKWMKQNHIPEISSFSHKSRHGATVSLFGRIEEQLKHECVQEFYKKWGFLPVKIGGDAASDAQTHNPSHKSLILFVMALCGVEGIKSSSAQTSEILAALFASENYESISALTERVRTEMKTIEDNGGFVEVDGKKYRVVFMLFGDLHFVHDVFGQQGASATFPCVYCKCHQDNLLNFLEIPSIFIERDLETIIKDGRTGDELAEELKIDDQLEEAERAFLKSDKSAASKRKWTNEKAKIRKKLNEKCRQNFNQKHSPLLRIPPRRFVFDTLHCRLRIVDLFFDILEAEVERYPHEIEKLRLKIRTALESIKVHKRITGFIGREAMKILDECATLCDALPDECHPRLKKFCQLFRETMHYFDSDRRFTPSEALIFRQICLNFGQWLTCEWPYINWKSVLYLHILVYHAWELLYEYGNLGIFSAQGLESLNAVTKGTKRNHTGWGLKTNYAVQCVEYSSARNSYVVVSNRPETRTIKPPTCRRCKGTRPGRKNCGWHQFCTREKPSNLPVWQPFDFYRSFDDVRQAGREPLLPIFGVRPEKPKNKKETNQLRVSPRIDELNPADSRSASVLDLSASGFDSCQESYKLKEYFDGVPNHQTKPQQAEKSSHTVPILESHFFRSSRLRSGFSRSRSNSEPPGNMSDASDSDHESEEKSSFTECDIDGDICMSDDEPSGSVPSVPSSDTSGVSSLPLASLVSPIVSSEVHLSVACAEVDTVAEMGTAAETGAASKSSSFVSPGLVSPKKPRLVTPSDDPDASQPGGPMFVFAGVGRKLGFMSSPRKSPHKSPHKSPAKRQRRVRRPPSSHDSYVFDYDDHMSD